MVAVLLPQAAAGTGAKSPVPRGAILFSSNRDGNAGLYLVNADGSGLKRLALSAPLDDLGASCVAWSPDGVKLAFESHNSSLVIVARGRSRRLHGPIGCGFAWSPDSRTIAYRTYGTAATALELVDVVTGKRSPLTAGNDSSVRWSPDGRRLAFLRYDQSCTTCSGLYVVRRDGSHLRLLSGGVFYPPSWSPDGKRLAFLARDGVFAINANGTGKRRLARGSLVPEWSPRGGELALSGYAVGGKPAVFLVRPNGSGLRLLLSFGSGSSPNVVWAPDGRQLAVQQGYGGQLQHPDIEIVDVVTGRSRQITQSGRYGYIAYLAQWDPRGRSTRALGGTAVSWAIPTDSTAAQDGLHTREPVEQLVADGSQVAIAYSGPRCLVELWRPGDKRPIRFPFAPSCQPTSAFPPSADLHPFNDLALGGDRVAFPVFSHQMGTNFHGIVTGARGRPAPEGVAGLCSGSPYCIRPPVGDVKAQASLIVFDSWEGPDFYCDAPCPPPKRHGSLWRIDGNQAVQIASSAGALTPLSVDAGRILVDHEDGSMDIQAADGSVLRSFTFNAALVRTARLQGPDLVVQTPTALEVTNAETGQFLDRRPLPAADATLTDVQSGIAVLVAGADVHLLRLSDGNDAVIHVAGSGPVLAQLEPSGLFYSYTVADTSYPGRVAFIPYDKLPLR